MKRVIVAARAEGMSQMMSYPLAKAISQICSKYHYIASRVYSRWGTLNLTISPENRRDYHPEIYFDEDFETHEIGFRIQTTSYGSINLAEYPEFLSACQDAYNMCNEVTKVIERIGVDESTTYFAPDNGNL